jgi:hypothetical protein
MGTINSESFQERTPEDKYQNSVDLWAKAELAASAEMPFKSKLNEKERGQISEIIQDLGSGYFVQEVNAFNGQNYSLVLENQNTGEEKEYFFPAALPVELPSINNSKGIIATVDERTEMLKKWMQELNSQINK